MPRPNDIDETQTLDDNSKPSDRSSSQRGKGRGKGNQPTSSGVSVGASASSADDGGIDSLNSDNSGKSRTKDKNNEGKRPGKDSDAFNVVPITNSLAVAGTFESVATPARDKLTGEPSGAPTLFVWENLGDSLLKIRGRAGWDYVEGCTPGVDALFAPQTITTTSITTSNGVISKLVAGQINAKVLTKDTFVANSAAAFTCSGFDGLFVAFNDGRAGYQQNSDTLLFLQGYDLTVGPVVVN